MTDPFDVETQRAAIDECKLGRMADPWKRHAYETISQDACVAYWIEQIADAELYKQRWLELEADDAS